MPHRPVPSETRTVNWFWPNAVAVAGIFATMVFGPLTLSPLSQGVAFGRNMGRALLAILTTTILADWGLRPYRAHLAALPREHYRVAFGPNMEGLGPPGNFLVLPEPEDLLYLAAYCFAADGHRASVVRIAMAAAINAIPPGQQCGDPHSPDLADGVHGAHVGALRGLCC
jgi:hypothetical protein